MFEEQSGSPHGYPELRLVLLGTIGCGKTLSGNTILGKAASPSAFSSPRICQTRRGLSEGRQLSLVESPRWYWSGGQVETSVRQETERALQLLAPGPHAFLLLIPVGQFTEVERQVPDQLEEVFGKGALRHTLVLFTCGDYLLGKGADEYLAGEDPALREVLHKCGGRYHIFNNRKLEERVQVRTLLEKVEEMVRRNGGCYIKSDLQADAKEREWETEKRALDTHSSKGQEEVRRRWGSSSGTRRQEQLREEESMPLTSRDRTDGVVDEMVTMRHMTNGLHAQAPSPEAREHVPHTRDQQERRASFRLSADGALLSQLSDFNSRESFVNTFHHHIAKDPAIQTESSSPSASSPFRGSTPSASFASTDPSPSANFASFASTGPSPSSIFASAGSSLSATSYSTGSSYSANSSFIVPSHSAISSSTVSSHSAIASSRGPSHSAISSSTSPSHSAIASSRSPSHSAMASSTSPSPSVGPPSIGPSPYSTPVPRPSTTANSPATDPELRLLLLGRKGSEKRVVGNCILGKDAFELQDDNTNSACERKWARVAEKQVVVVDVPDWVGTGHPLEEIRQQLSTALALSAPGPHTFLLSVPVNKPADVELRALGVMEELLGRTVLRSRAVVVFTHSELLGAGGAGLEEYVATRRPDLLQLVEKCGDRYHVLERDGAGELLDKVEQVVKEGGGTCFNLEADKEQAVKDRDLRSSLQSVREVDEEDEKEQAREKLERGMSQMDGPPSLASSQSSTSILSSLSEQVLELLRRVPKLLAGGALLGGVVGVFLGGPLGGAVGATVGTVTAEVGRRKYGNKMKTQ
ncbi:uncharacterized protein LOC108939806 isoform X1 [Scleropages formosus]|uniref:GTPase IMAP family member 8 n=1 Tax=Scleropages formosus TaxID=113540 RepID=A0A8C9W5L7_SCLFO|nr:uncharacterized protein LOC108939806 isoform X1 [Scleropages formosus]